MGCLWGKRPRSYTESFGPYFPGLWGECYLLNQLHTSHSRPLRSCIVTKTQVKEQRASHMGPRSLIVCLGTRTRPLRAAPHLLPQDSATISVRWSSGQFRGWIHVHTHVHTDTHMYMEHTHKHMYTHRHTDTQPHICIWKHMRDQTDVYTCIHRDIHGHTTTHAYVRTHICTQTHT